MELLDIGNCLQYQKFKYDSSEWDNVANVVPRYSIYLEKYLEKISEKCQEFNKRETVLHLRGDLEN